MKKIVVLTFIMLAVAAIAAAQKTKDKLSKEERQAVTELFYEASRMKVVGESNKAADLLKKVIAADNQAAAAYYELGNYQLASKQLPEAVANYERATELEPENVWYKKALANAYQSQGDRKAALKVYDELLKSKKEDIDLLFEKAQLQYEANDLDGSIKTLDKIESMMGISSEVISQKQDIYIKQGKIDKAADEIGKLIKEYPEELSFLGVLADMYEANNMLEKAIATYKKLLQKDPNNGKAHYAMAQIAFNNKNQADYEMHIKKAFESSEVNIDTKVFHMMPYINALIAKDENKTIMAMTLGELILKAHPKEAKAEALYGDLQYQTGNDLVALAHYKSAVRLDNTAQQVWNQIMMIEAEKNKKDDLYKTAEEALSLFPNSGLVNYFVGITTLDRKEYSKAKMALENVAMMSYDNKQLTEEAYTRLGELYNETKEYDKSDKNFDKVIAMNAKNALAKNNHAYYLSLRNEQLEKAEKLSKSSLELEADNPSYLDTYGWILYQLGNYTDALTYINKALDKGGSGSPDVLEHAGDVYYKLGDISKALAYWNKAKEKGNNTPVLQSKIDAKKIK